ncbi:hypothetical protein BN8_03603 [Fibrisoma limi BUZ 3]|uniref:Uncharacterized protein n=1 Tax=Fibrisoma limi BUZ 3 TaxID=1185876 RepID=I2GKL1_9BACT|nr:hypothetical protein [Fibrisoma limi]CCH54437.1 hypothetical protein BN8_03603 [Fibrisoma limi BUZ 3]
MSQSHNTKLFEALSQEYLIFVISYTSPRWPNPLFLIWYTDTDEDSTDRLLTDQAGNIIATESIPELISTLKAQVQLTLPEQFIAWLARIEGLEPSVDISHDTKALVDSIANKKVDLSTLERLVLWRNMFGDFAYQDGQNSYLLPYHDDPLLKQASDYYYNYDFWPRYTTKSKGQTVRWRRPPLEIDTALLLEKLSATITMFDARINLVKPG